MRIAKLPCGAIGIAPYAMLLGGAVLTSSLAWKQFGPNLRPRNRSGGVGTMRGYATMQLSLLGLRQLNNIGCFRDNAIPNILYKLNALRDGQLEVFCSGGGSGHGHSINQGKRNYTTGCDLSRIHCDSSHFSPVIGGRPACSVFGSPAPSASTFSKINASPGWPRNLMPILGNSVSPPA